MAKRASNLLSPFQLVWTAKLSALGALVFVSAIACSPTTAEIEQPAPKKTGANARPCDNSGLWVVNGVTTNDFPAVVHLTTAQGGTCTGTFVGSNTVITASHCLESAQNAGLFYNNVAAIRTINFGAAGETAIQIPWQDVNVLLFPDGTAPAISPLAQMPPKGGDPITIVGYGQTDFINDNDVDGLKRFGRNVITDVTDGGVVVHYTAPAAATGAPGSNSMSGRGDSGGPLFTDTGLVAITSNGGFDGVSTLDETDVSMFSNHSLELFEMAITQGAQISGIENVRRANGINTGGTQPGIPGQNTGVGTGTGVVQPGLQGGATGTSGQQADCT